jgi:hypothetical protein
MSFKLTWLASSGAFRLEEQSNIIANGQISDLFTLEGSDEKPIE